MLLVIWSKTLIVTRSLFLHLPSTSIIVSRSLFLHLPCTSIIVSRSLFLHLTPTFITLDGQPLISNKVNVLYTTTPTNLLLYYRTRGSNYMPGILYKTSCYGHFRKCGCTRMIHSYNGSSKNDSHSWWVLVVATISWKESGSNYDHDDTHPMSEILTHRMDNDVIIIGPIQ